MTKRQRKKNLRKQPWLPVQNKNYYHDKLRWRGSTIRKFYPWFNWSLHCDYQKVWDLKPGGEERLIRVAAL